MRERGRRKAVEFKEEIIHILKGRTIDASALLMGPGQIIPLQFLLV